MGGRPHAKHWGELTKKQRRDKRRNFWRQHELTVEDWKLICLFYLNHCVKCKRYFESFLELTPDHVDGDIRHRELWNIQPLCFSCNSGKGRTHFDSRWDEGRVLVEWFEGSKCSEICQFALWEEFASAELIKVGGDPLNGRVNATQLLLMEWNNE